MAAPQDSGSIYSDIRLRLDKLQQDITSVKTGFDKLGKNIQSSSDKSTKTMTDNFKKINLAGTAAIGAVTLAFKSAITTFANTEQSLANVRAVSNATAEEFKTLKDAAEEAGTTTRFTASQAADALFYLSSAGLDATQSVKALDGVLLLAGATGSDLAQSAQAVTSTLSQFGLEASQASDVANVFAAANSNSQATLDKLQNSLRQVGPVAAGLGISLEETVGSLQALYNAGFQGENAGLALKSALADLANQASPTIEKLNKLGVSFADVNPETVGLTNAIGALEEAGLSTAEIIDVFGKVAGPQLVTLIKAGKSELQDYTKAITGTNEAARQYAIQNDTLSGSIDSLKSAIEGTSNSFIQQLSPILRGFLDFLTFFLKIVNQLPSPLKALGIGAAGAAVGFTALSTALSLVGVSLTGPIGLIAAAGALVVVLGSTLSKIKEIQEARLDETFGAIAQEVGLTGESVDDFVDKAADLEGVFASATVFNRDLAVTRESLKKLALSYGLSEVAIVKIALAARSVTDEQKEQLKQIANQISLESEQFNLKDQSIDKEKRLAELKAEQAEADEKAQAIADEIEAKENERVNRINVLKGQLSSLDELFRKGGISEKEALEEKIKLRQNEINTITAQALAQDEITDLTIQSIDEQKAAIDRYSERLDELAVHEEELANKKYTDEQQAAANRINLALKTVDAIEDREKRRREKEKKEDDKEAEEKKNRLKERQDAYKQTYDIVYDAAKSFFNSLTDLKVNQINAEISEIERSTKAQLSAIDEETKALLESLGLQEETKIESLQRRLQEAIDAGDTETANELNQELQREQILQNAEDEKNAIQEASEKKVAELKYKAELAAWRASKINAAIAGAEGAIQAYKALAGIPYVGPALGIAAAAAVGIAAAAQIAAINANKPQAPQLATGGIVLPQSGGTPAVLAENGAAELALNAGSEGEALLQQFASKVANAGGSGGGSFVLQLFMDGRIVAENSADYYNNGIVKVVLK